MHRPISKIALSFPKQTKTLNNVEISQAEEWNQKPFGNGSRNVIMKEYGIMKCDH